MNKSTAQFFIKKLDDLESDYHKTIASLKAVLLEEAIDDEKLTYQNIYSILLESNLFPEEKLNQDGALIPSIIGAKLTASELRKMLNSMKNNPKVRSPAGLLMTMLKNKRTPH